MKQIDRVKNNTIVLNQCEMVSKLSRCYICVVVYPVEGGDVQQIGLSRSAVTSHSTSTAL